MFSNRSALVALGILAATNVLACAAIDGDDTSTIEQEKRIKPQDSEALGKITIEAPPGWTLPPNPDQDATAAYESPEEGGQAIKLGTTLRLKASTGCVVVRSKLQAPTSLCGVEVKKNKTTTVKLGSLKAAYDDKLLATDFGPKPMFRIHHKEDVTGGQPEEHEIYAHDERSNFLSWWNGTHAQGVLAAPGDYRFAWNLPILGEVKKTLAQGENAQIALVPNDVRGTIVIKAPAARELPNAPTNGCQTKDRTFIVQRRVENGGEPNPYDQRMVQANPTKESNHIGQNEGIDAWRALAITGTTTLKVFPFTAAEAPKHYDVVVNSLVQTLDVKPGKTSTVQLERLDVDDVEVEREDGSKYNEHGTWKVWRKDANGAWEPLTRRYGQYSDCSGSAQNIQADFPTGHGIDVLPGDYRIQVDYSTAEGAKKQEFTVSVP
jgi:hypothetical protein